MRVHSVDAYRGLIVVLMLVYHYFAVSSFLKGVDVWVYESRLGFLFGHFIRISFLMLVGLSTRLIIDSKKDFYAIQFDRFLKVSLAAVFVSLLTYIVIPEAYVIWGVLHLIAFAILCLSLGKVVNRRVWILISISFLFVGTKITGQLTSGSPLLIPFGFYPKGFWTVDYFPIFPWAGIVFLGYGFSDVLLRLFGGFKLRLKGFEWIGKKALWIYLIHVPLLYLLVNYLL